MRIFWTKDDDVDKAIDHRIPTLNYLTFQWRCCWSRIELVINSVSWLEIVGVKAPFVKFIPSLSYFSCVLPQKSSPTLPQHVCLLSLQPLYPHPKLYQNYEGQSSNFTKYFYSQNLPQ